MDHHVILVLASDAVYDNDGVMQEVGPVTKRRINEAVYWYRYLTSKSSFVRIVFTAGVPPRDEKSFTLGQLCAAYLRQRVPFFPQNDMWVNETDRQYWGVLEQVSLLFRFLRRQHLHCRYTLHIVASLGHLYRARVSLCWFFINENISCRLHELSDGSRFRFWHECGAYVRLALIKIGLLRSRCGNL